MKFRGTDSDLIGGRSERKGGEGEGSDERLVNFR